MPFDLPRRLRPRSARQIRQAHTCRFPSGNLPGPSRSLTVVDTTDWSRAIGPSPRPRSYMTKTQRRLTVTVEEAGALLGVGRSTAYELVRSGDLPCIRLRRRIVVPVALIAQQLGVSASELLRTVGGTDGKGLVTEAEAPAATTLF